MRNLHVEGEKFKELVLLKTIPKELFNFEYWYDCKKSSIRKLVQFIAVKCFIEGFLLKLIMPIVSCLDT